MWPILVSFGSFQIYTYGVLIALAFIGAMTVGLKLGPRYGLEKPLIWDWMFFVLLGAILGARLLYLALEWKHVKWSLRQLGDLFIHSGGVFYGGFVGAILASVWFLRRRQVSIWLAADIAAPAVALGQGIGRWGCFFAGCCWGKTTSLPWAITFHNEVTGRLMGTPLNTPLHPTQLYESFFTLALAGWLWHRHRRKHRRGDLWWGYVAVYATGRFLIEFFRDDPRGRFAWFFTSQWFALAAVALTLVWVFFYRARQPVEQAAAAQPRERGDQ